MKLIDIVPVPAMLAKIAAKILKYYFHTSQVRQCGNKTVYQRFNTLLKEGSRDPGIAR
jgi:hypothetical protein